MESSLRDRRQQQQREQQQQEQNQPRQHHHHQPPQSQQNDKDREERYSVSNMTSPNHSSYRPDASASTFPQSSQPVDQYHDPHNQFSAPGAPAYPMDQEMAHMENFAASVRNATVDASMSDPASVGVDSISNARSPSGSQVASSRRVMEITSAPGMLAQGQVGTHHHQSQPQTPYSPTPTGPRTSIDDGSANVDPGLGMIGLSSGDPKRKRSKVSRACDECRRKKVRCDAAADDGTIKTCTNCQKNGLLCGYNRIPMKRGPSKGYIKELSERVQQVESQMALSNTSAGFRQSLDGNAGAMYTEQLYSPDDNLSFKRNFSFSDQQAQRSPFANPEFNRDRMPSLGGWNSSASPHASGAGLRNRGSIAIAPDQQAPSIGMSRPYWLTDDINPRPTKKRKMASDLEERVVPLALTNDALSSYYDQFHATLPLLPDADMTIKLVTVATSTVQHAFMAAVDLLPDFNITVSNGQAHDEHTKHSRNTVFASRNDLEDFIWDIARDDPQGRPKEDNLVLLWVYLLLAVGVEDDLSRVHGGNLSRGILIKQAIDLGWAAIQIEDRVEKDLSGFYATDDHTVSLARAWHCAGILSRFHAFGTGTCMPLPPGHKTPLPNPRAIFTLQEGFVVFCNVTLTNVINLMKTDYPSLPTVVGIDGNVRMHILSYLEDVRTLVPVDAANHVIYEQTVLFYDLITSRAAYHRSTTEILLPAIHLAESLKKHMVASGEKYTYNPLRVHFFTVTVITLLEFRQEGMEAGMTKLAGDGIDILRVALEQISEREDLGSHLQENSGGEERAATDVTADTAATNDGATAIEQSAEPVHWANALLKMIVERSKVAEVNGAVSGANTNAEPDTNHNSSTTVAVEEGTRNDGKMEAPISLNFGLLLKHGYLNVLASSAGV